MAKILAIDDDPQVLTTVSRLLGAEGYEVCTAAGGAEGIRLASEHHPELILCDIIMPEPNGFDVLATLRRDIKTASIPVVFLTGLPDPTQLRDGKSLAADDYLLKPFTRSELMHAVEARLARVAFVRREARRRLEDLQAALAGTLPQNLLTPLATMLGLSAFLRDEGTAVPPELVCEVAQGIFEGSRRLHQTMEKFVVYADLERLAQALRTTPSFVAKHRAQTGPIVTEAAIEAARGADRQADLALHVDDLAVRIDVAHLRRLVLELVENAVNCSSKGNPVTVDCRRVDSACQLTIRDHGPGLPAERLEDAVLQPGCRTLDGRGYGLPIAKRIAALCGAAMVVAPAPEGGTTVTLALPLRD